MRNSKKHNKDLFSHIYGAIFWIASKNQTNCNYPGFRELIATATGPLIPWAIVINKIILSNNDDDFPEITVIIGREDCDFWWIGGIFEIPID